MTEWTRQHRESLLHRGPGHLEDPTPTRAALLGLRLMVCGTTTTVDDHGLDTIEDPPLDDRCPACQGEYIAGRAG